jgi:hypothetical protein
MTGLETALMVAGTAISAVGAIQQGQAQQKAANYNAALAERNGVIARQQAAENAKRQERINRKKLATSRNSLVSLDVLEDNAKEAELERLSIIYEGELAAQTGSANAALLRTRGRSAAGAGYASAAGVLLEGGVKIGETQGWFDDATA